MELAVKLGTRYWRPFNDGGWHNARTTFAISAYRWYSKDQPVYRCRHARFAVVMITPSKVELRPHHSACQRRQMPPDLAPLSKIMSEPSAVSSQ